MSFVSVLTWIGGSICERYIIDLFYASSENWLCDLSIIIPPNTLKSDLEQRQLGFGTASARDSVEITSHAWVLS